MKTVLKIHPAIGVARLGNSEDFYIAPETVGGLPIDRQGNPVTSFRDGEKKLKRQAARFGIFAYDDGNPEGRKLKPGDALELEDGSAKLKEIRWTAYLANKKASWYQFMQLEGENGYRQGHPLRNQSVVDPEERKKLIIDPGPLTLTGANQQAAFTQGEAQNNYPQTFPPSNLQPDAIDTLGDIQTDEDGHLLVLGGMGHSGSSITPPSISNYANNPGWFDDISDGPVSATLIMDNGNEIPVDIPSWVLVAPPGYAPEILNMVTLYDAMYDVSVRNFSYNPTLFKDDQFNSDYEPDYKSEIEPILKRPAAYKWLTQMPPSGVTPHDKLLEDSSSSFPFLFVRSPDKANAMGLMPHLAGDNPITQTMRAQFLTLTATQYFLLQQWKNGKSRTGGGVNVGPGEVLDKATLENCVGGAFCPGIEMTWICRNAEIYSEPFRIKHKKLTGSGLSLNEDFSLGLEPGDISKYMALPWQADFNECATQGNVGGNPLWWWPAQRPYDVHPEDDSGNQVQWARGIGSDLDMVANWMDLGFVINKGTEQSPNFVEVERNPLDTPPTGEGIVAAPLAEKVEGIES